MKLTHFEQVIITATRTLPEVLVTTNPNVIGYRTPCGKFLVAITDNDVAIGKLNVWGTPIERETFRFPYTNLVELANYIQEFKKQYAESVYDPYRHHPLRGTPMKYILANANANTTTNATTNANANAVGDCIISSDPTLTIDVNTPTSILRDLAARALGWVDRPYDPLERGSVWHCEAQNAPYGPTLHKLHWRPDENSDQTLALIANLGINITVNHDEEEIKSRVLIEAAKIGARKLGDLK